MGSKRTMPIVRIHRQAAARGGQVVQAIRIMVQALVESARAVDSLMATGSIHNAREAMNANRRRNELIEASTACTGGIPTAMSDTA